MSTATKKQKEILEFIQEYTEEYAVSPSFQEIADEMGYSSLATVHRHLENLCRKGIIRKVWNEARSVEIIAADLPFQMRINDLLAQRDALLEAAKDFVAKVDSGRARSVDSYRKFKAAIAMAEGEK